MKEMMKMNHAIEASRTIRLRDMILLTLALSLAMVLVSTSAAWAETISGNCGPDDKPEAVTWTLNDAGTLTVSGTGPMRDSFYDSIVDSENRYKVKKLVVKEGVTSIGEEAFYDMEMMETATLPNSLRTIGENSFRSCICLSDIKIPTGVKSIPSGAFAVCLDLSTITLPDTINTIDVQAFSLCPCLKKVNFQGTLAQWKKVSIAAGNNSLKNASLAYKKLAQPMKVKAKTASASAKKLAKAKQTIAISKALSFTTKAQGKVTYAKVSGSGKLAIAKSTGKITVKKGTKKGTYKIKVKVSAAGNAEYKAGSKTLTLRVQVK